MHATSSQTMRRGRGASGHPRLDGPRARDTARVPWTTPHSSTLCRAGLVFARHRIASHRIAYATYPLTRGNSHGPIGLVAVIGLIPADAGNTAAGSPSPWWSRAHPRVHGERPKSPTRRPSGRGAHPRMRGEHGPIDRSRPSALVSSPHARRTRHHGSLLGDIGIVANVLVIVAKSRGGIACSPSSGWSWKVFPSCARLSLSFSPYPLIVTRLLHDRFCPAGFPVPGGLRPRVDG